jgi:hypothetical protein
MISSGSNLFLIAPPCQFIFHKSRSNLAASFLFSRLASPHDKNFTGAISVHLSHSRENSLQSAMTDQERA